MRTGLLIFAAALTLGIPTVDAGRRPLARVPQPPGQPVPAEKVWYGGTLPPIVVAAPALVPDSTCPTPATHHASSGAYRDEKRGPQ